MSFAEFIVRSSAFGIHDLFKTGVIRALLTNNDSPTFAATALGVGFVLCIIVSYLLGSVNTALLVSKLIFHDDVRERGSGNAGTTNVLRTYGKKAAIITFVGDVLKGVLAVLFACILFGHPNTEYSYVHLLTAAYMSAFFCIFGHVFPVFSQFRGGKGFATLAGVILVLNPFIFVLLLLFYIPMVLLSHYISLSSVIAALFYPMMLSVIDSVVTGMGVHVLFTVMMGVLITWAHRGNLRRIYDGEERKFYLKRKKIPTSVPTSEPAEDTTEAPAEEKE